MSSQRLVKVIIVAVPGTDPDLAALRSAMLAAGGSVYSRFSAVAALSGLLPAAQVATLAARADVQGISPDRMTARTASALELMTCASSVRSGGAAGYSGLDGSGVGIAVLDSGVMGNHRHFSNPAGASRIARSVNLLKAGDSSATGGRKWATGEDGSAALYPGSASMAKYENKIAVQAANLSKDFYGHGGHVAGVAAGRGAYQALDATGIAPSATLYDVKVLGNNGFGQLSDVLAGIDWVLHHAREYNIRVMNLSLAADSTESWQTDPLARAARWPPASRWWWRPATSARAPTAPSASAASARPGMTRR